MNGGCRRIWYAACMALLRTRLIWTKSSISTRATRSSWQVLKLNKALYGLRRSPLLWQQKLTNEMKKLGYAEIPQEPCIVQKNGIICFFYVDDIVFAYRKEQSEEVKRTIASISEAPTLEDKGELKWFQQQVRRKARSAALKRACRRLKAIFA